MNPSDHHSDPSDVASDNEQTERETAVSAIQAKIKPIVKSDICLSCEKPTLSGRRWCDKFCRDDWEKWSPEA